MQIVATKGWSAANPEVAGWLKNFKITPEQLSSLMLDIQTAGKGKEQETAKAWIAKNQAAGRLLAQERHQLTPLRQTA